ncbi:extracellular solute-binding protein [Microbacterium sp. zg.Y1090]|uniref:extracellular solute-binding protein n=1 Tax=Microbacterium wangruii TaxID=3049073 RepID=UPI00214C1BD8|nr:MULTISPECIES: extracellular solute-binding protein [unclassified Microbacterium]MCR2817537.1 extracellular solute-binding protein [Microbacterium sp. zg.Y1090]WIM28981.1 extracellular solute-binding protein [Microbacterium sp. zg-Y1090]
MRATSTVIATVGVLALTVTLGGCSAGGAESDENTVTVVYSKTDSFTALDTLLTQAKEQFEAENEGVTIDLQPITATDDEYKTRLQLSLGSPDTAPDVFYEDTFNVRSDVEAGYLLNLDEYLADWDDWGMFDEAAKTAGQGEDGSIYALPLGTDTRVIWYNTNVMDAAGIEVPWQPETWDDILDAAAKIKASQPDVVPFNMYAGTGTGEGTVMQGFYELLYGTGDGTGLYDDAEGKWIVESQGFVDALTFLETLYSEGYAVSPDRALDPNVWQAVFGEMFPQDGLGATVEGSYTPSFWEEGGAYPWPEYGDVMQVALFPTQDGQDPGGVSMSGGWTLATSAETDVPDLAVEFLQTVLNQENSLWYAINNAQIAVRTDVASDPTYLEANPFVGDVSEAVSVTHFRPANSDYPQISVAVQEATEAVITGQQTAAEAAAAYDDAVRRIVGDEKVIAQ